MDIIALTIAVCSLVAAVVALLESIKTRKKISEMREDFNVEFEDFNKHTQSIRKELDELRRGSLGLYKRFEGFKSSLEHLNEIQEDLKLQDPESRLYSRARKMISLGADIDEIVRECEIPKSEAELLFSVQGKALDNNTAPIKAQVKEGIKTSNTNINPNLNANLSSPLSPNQKSPLGVNANTNNFYPNRFKNAYALNGDNENNNVDDSTQIAGELKADKPLPNEALGLMEHFKR